MNLRPLFLTLMLSVSSGSRVLASEYDTKLLEKHDPVASDGWRQALTEGHKQQALKHLDVAEACFLQALKEAKRVHAAPADLVTCYRSLGESQKELDLIEDAVPSYKHALKILEKDDSENFALLAETLGNLGDIAYGEGDYKKSKAYFAQALKVLADQKQGRTYLYASLERRYGRCAYKLNDPKDASEVYYDALQTMINLPDLPNHSLLIETLADYTDLFRNTQDQGGVRQSSVQKELLKDAPDVISNGKGVAPSLFSTTIASRLADQAVARASSTVTSKPASSPLPGESSILNLPGSQITPDQQLPDVALGEQIGQQRIDFYERMVAVDIKALGPNHPSVARDLTSLATVYLAANNFAEAKPLLQRALVIYQHTYGDTAKTTEQTKTLIRIIAEEQRARDAGEPPSNEYLSKLPQLPVAAQTPEVALRLNYLALQCYSYGKTSQALLLYSWALAATARVAGDRSMLTACCLNDYAHVLRSCDQVAQATRFESDAAAIVRESIVKRAANKSI